MPLSEIKPKLKEFDLDIDTRDVKTAIQAAQEAGAAGREKTLEQYLAEQRVKRGLPESWPPSETVTEVAPGVFKAN